MRYFIILFLLCVGMFFPLARAGDDPAPSVLTLPGAPMAPLFFEFNPVPITTSPTPALNELEQ